MKFLLFKGIFLENTGKSCCRKFFEEFSNQFIVKTVERSTDKEETTMTTTVTPNQKDYFKFSELFTTHFL